MPRTDSGLALVLAYQRSLGVISRAAGQATSLLWASTVYPGGNVEESFNRFRKEAGESTRTYQYSSLGSAERFLNAYGTEETGSYPGVVIDKEEWVGRSSTGEPVEDALLSSKAAMMVALSAGAAVGVASGVGKRTAGTYMRSATVDVARLAQHRAQEGLGGMRGWKRNLNPPSCGGCAAAANGEIHDPGVPLGRHPGCDCVAVPVFDGVAESVEPISGKDYVDSLPPEEQRRFLAGGTLENLLGEKEYVRYGRMVFSLGPE